MIFCFWDCESLSFYYCTKTFLREIFRKIVSRKLAYCLLFLPFFYFSKLLRLRTAFMKHAKDGGCKGISKAPVSILTMLRWRNCNDVPGPFVFVSEIYVQTLSDQLTSRKWSHAPWSDESEQKKLIYKSTKSARLAILKNKRVGQL